jgi:uncharacterized membrane protein required for colicin V production
MQNYIWLLWDIAAAVIIILCIRHCARQGLVRTIISLLAYFIAAAAARALSPAAAELLYDYVVKDAMILFVSRELGDTLASGQELVGQVLESFPAILRQYAPALAELEGSGYASMEAAQLVESLVEAVLKNPVMMMLSGLAFLLLFSLVLIVIRFIARLFTDLYKVPVIGPVNTFLGGVVGALQAVLFLVLGSLALRLAISLTGGELIWLNARVMDDTYIWRVFYGWISP